MMDDINFIILSRLKYASIPFEVRNKLLDNSKERKVEKEKPRKVNPAVPIAADEPCPCGSGKNTANVTVVTFAAITESNGVVKTSD